MPRQHFPSRLCHWVIAAVLSAAACAKKASGPESINAAALLRHIQTLASDEFQGRAPGTRGEDLTISYISDRFHQMGLKPAGSDAAFLQKVPLVRSRSRSTATFQGGAKKMVLSQGHDFAAISRHLTAEVRVENSDVVFVGYGIVAPEYGWDDYNGTDVKGKTVIMFLGDPPIPASDGPSKLDESLFQGRALTRYGISTYKYEIAAEKGAAAAILIHDAGSVGKAPAGAGALEAEMFEIRRPSHSRQLVSVESRMGRETAERLFAASGQEYEALKSSALRKEFRPVRLRARASFVVNNRLQEVQSHNVLGVLEGRDPAHDHEVVVYMAHWDHLGRNEGAAGDRVFNGAIDNASGVASVLELARAFSTLPRRPGRSMLFLCTTAEEPGHLGARYYVENPIYPLHKTIAVINIDRINPWGRTRDVVLFGPGATPLGELLRKVAQSHGRRVQPDPEPERGFFFRLCAGISGEPHFMLLSGRPQTRSWSPPCAGPSAADS